MFGPFAQDFLRPVSFRTDSRLAVIHPVSVWGNVLTQKRLSSVPCPTCGMPAGMRCERYMGVLRKVFHVNRQLAAVAAETNREAERHRPATQPRHPRPDTIRLGVQNGTTFHFGLHCGSRLLHPVSVKKRLNAKQMSSVPCPTCGAAPGMPCEIYSGGIRRPHVDRKFVAIEALVQEAETVHAGPSRRKSKRSSS